MKVVIDQNIRGAKETFGAIGDLYPMDGRKIRRRHLQDADVLIIRTATRADGNLLAGTPVKFVGTTSIGSDHLDIPWLERHGIAWANAPGCNADSAAQYTLAMIWLACQRLGRDLHDQTIGIIGRGNVGSRLHDLLSGLGIAAVANDPPLSDAGVTGLVSQAEALACDIVSLHVPLTFSGRCPTHQMIGESQLQDMKRGALMVNAARGDVIEGRALLAAVQSCRVHAALDVWPGEPALDPEMIERSVVATPHVAGYSQDGKHNGTRMVYAAYCAKSGVDLPELAPQTGRRLSMTIAQADEALGQVLEAACFVARHDEAMRSLARGDPADIAAGFDRLRKEYPYRRDFQGWDVHCRDEVAARTLRGLGFSIEP